MVSNIDCRLATPMVLSSISRSPDLALLPPSKPHRAFPSAAKQPTFAAEPVSTSQRILIFYSIFQILLASPPGFMLDSQLPNHLPTRFLRFAASFLIWIRLLCRFDSQRQHRRLFRESRASIACFKAIAVDLKVQRAHGDILHILAEGRSSERYAIDGFIE